MTATVTPMRTTAENALIERFASLSPALPGDDTVSALRQKAFAPIQKIGLPNRRVEAYKYTDLRSLMRDAPPPAPEVQADKLKHILAQTPALAIADAIVIRFVNGYLAGKPTLLPDGVDLMPLHGALSAQHPAVTQHLGKEMAQAGTDALVGLNTAFMHDGAFIRIPAGMQISRPIYLAFETQANNPVAVFPRILVSVENNASVSIVESHTGPDGVAYQNNSAVEISVGDHAHVEHVRLYADGRASLSFSTLAASLGREAVLNSTAFAAGPKAARHQVFLDFAGRDAKAAVRGITLLRGEEHADHTLNVDHAQPGGESRELFRTVIDDTATGVFQGKITVRRDAQKTDGRMASNALLLGEAAIMNNKPELEIFADDVQCAHGATCGALDESLLFYLMARGIPRRDAEALMIESFVGEAIDMIENEAVRDALADRVRVWLQART
ncbi:MAG: Fe-S cluster assembly protein SufD [Beijerinckiaceae bacterium]